MSFYRSLIVLALTLSLVRTHAPGVVIYKANLTGPFNSQVRAFGNFDVMNPIGQEDRDQLKQAQTAIDNMIKHYGRAEFQRGPTYALEYYRDSSINTVAYVFYKQNGSQVTKYYCLRAEFGKTKDTFHYLGSEKTAGVRAGHQMPLLGYRQVGKDNSQFISSTLALITTSSLMVYSPASVVEAKYWEFPEGRLYLLRCQNSNSSSIYFTLLNASSTMTLLSHTFVPPFLVSIDIDYFFVNSYIKRFLNNLYHYSLFVSQSVLSQVIFLEMFFDPLYGEGVHIMVTLSQTSHGFKFSRAMGIIWNQPASGSPFPIIRSMRSSGMYLMDEFNYTSPSQNRFHNVSYFNNNDYDERMGYGWIDPAQEITQMQSLGLSPRTCNITKIYRINYPKYRVSSMEVWYHEGIMLHFYAMRERKGEYDLGNFAMRLMSTPVIASQPFNPYEFEKRSQEAARTKLYNDEFDLLYGVMYSGRQYERASAIINREYCPLNDGQLQLGFMYYSNWTARNVFIFSSFLRDTSTNNVYDLGRQPVTQNDKELFTQVSSTQFRPKSVCKLISVRVLPAAEADDFYGKAQTVLLDKDNQPLPRTAIIRIVTMQLVKVKLKDIWRVDCSTNGNRFSIMVTLDASNRYSLIGFTFAPVQASNAVPNGGTAGTGNSSTQAASSNTGAGGVPLIGGAVPTYELNGNGDLTKAAVDSLFPSLLGQIEQNSPNTCRNITTLSYFVDPLSKIVAFMLSCPEASGNSVYEIVALLESNEFLFMGSKSLLVVPSNYWQLQPADASTALRNAIASSVRATFTAGVELQQILFVSQLAFVKGEFNLVGYSLNDGSNLQAGYLCFGNGTCTHLTTNVVQMGTGKPPSSQVAPGPVESVTPGSNTASSAQSIASSSSGSSGGSNASISDSSNATSSDKGTTSDSSSGSASGSSSSSSSSSNNNNNNNNGYGGLFGGVIALESPISYSTLSPGHVKSDPYLIPIYNALLPKLPRQVASLQIRSIEKGTFSNGTISYQIYYGSASATTCFLTVFFDPARRQVFYLTLTQTASATSSAAQETSATSSPSPAPASSAAMSPGFASASASFSSSSSPFRNSSPAQSTAGSSPMSGNQALLRQIFTAWAWRQHPQLGNEQPSRVQIEICRSWALGTLYFTTSGGQKYKAQLWMSLATAEVRELSFAPQK